MFTSGFPVLKKVPLYASLVKLEHTIFALPFALSSLLLAAPYGEWPPLTTVTLVILAMIGGRTYAMGLNRLLDAKIDAKNPRTASREIPAGKISEKEGWLLTLTALVLLIAAVMPLPRICFYLLPLAILILTGYSYTKRFTSLCHLILGLALGSSAIGGWLALTGSWNGGLPVILGAAVLFWVAGFDIIYACQDESFDRQEGLHSIPVQLGTKKALLLSTVFHAVSGICLLLFGALFSQLLYPLGWPFWLVSSLMISLMAWQHTLVKADDLSRVNQAFFVLNGGISIGFFVGVLVMKILQG